MGQKRVGECPQPTVTLCVAVGHGLVRLRIGWVVYIRCALAGQSKSGQHHVGEYPQLPVRPSDKVRSDPVLVGWFTSDVHTLTESKWVRNGLGSAHSHL